MNTDEQSTHRHTFSQSTAFSEDVDSTATTLFGGSGGGSFDEGRKYADVELERWERRKHGVSKYSKEDYEYHEDHEDAGYDTDSTLSNLPSHREEHHTLLTLPPLTRPTSHTSFGDDSEPPPPPRSPTAKQVSWSDLPRKSQLTILTLARLSEPLTQTSLQSYMFYQLKSFPLADGSTPSDGTVAKQAGILAAAFTGAQFLTAMLWGRAADSEWFGRKRVILIGLLGTAIGSLGFGFSGSFAQAVVWRAVGGALNGNIGVMRTMISEIIREKRFQSRAFLLMPMTFNVGVIIGPLLGGLLADPVGSWPGVFEGVGWLRRWPYALPNVVNALFLGLSALALVFGLEETLEGRRGRVDWGLTYSRWVGRVVFRRKARQEYRPVVDREDGGEEDLEMSAATPTAKEPAVRRKLPFRRIWTSNVLFTLVSHGLMACHVGTFNNLWFVFLSTPRYDPASSQHRPRSAHPATGPSEALKTVPKNYHPHLPFVFTGGLALPPPSIGTALAILGVIGISLQLLLYPRLSFRLGTTRSFRLSILLFPISYFLAPYLSALPSSTPPPGQATGFLVWLGITLVLCVQVMARTFALPAAAILVNNSCPHPSVLGTLHGIAQSVSSATRTVGPVLFGWLYGVGLEKGVVGTAWWGMAGVAVLGAVAGRFVREGDGHEIWLEGEREEEAEGKG
ncbi:uncharacterized protein LTR77_007696 [Saxophila tyrrhenica]|uniref:Major facilitator superfamily (MFS) profile domain-containing protein n=1 Tax=Saxophila tyrrhenica TaxID=1690608 RepID=A0AAV9P2R5_9PEZI|nr:hypothetical protein LTR77_007696 [Saxophila tyrrhenica]